MHMKIAIIGAGAMGCLFACLLDNYEVTLYDVSPVASAARGRNRRILSSCSSRIRQEKPRCALIWDLSERTRFCSRCKTVWETLRSCNGTSPQSVFCLARHGTTASREHPALSTIPEPAKRRSAHRPAISQWQKQLPPYCPRMRPRWSPARTSSACCGQN